MVTTKTTAQKTHSKNPYTLPKQKEKAHTSYEHIRPLLPNHIGDSGRRIFKLSAPHNGRTKKTHIPDKTRHQTAPGRRTLKTPT